jgi:hypothetical protein
MSAMTDFLEQKIGDSLFGDTAWSIPATYVSLLTAAASDSTAGTEVTNAGAYARVLINNDSTTSPYWSAYTAGVYDNVQDVAFATASASWGTVSHFKLTDNGAYGAGNNLVHGALSSSKTVDTNDTFKFAAGDLDMTLD